MNFNTKNIPPFLKVKKTIKLPLTGIQTQLAYKTYKYHFHKNFTQALHIYFLDLTQSTLHQHNSTIITFTSLTLTDNIIQAINLHLTSTKIKLDNRYFSTNFTYIVSGTNSTSSLNIHTSFPHNTYEISFSNIKHNFSNQHQTQFTDHQP